jgi:hypothetical protein
MADRRSLDEIVTEWRSRELRPILVIADRGHSDLVRLLDIAEAAEKFCKADMAWGEPDGSGENTLKLLGDLHRAVRGQ